MTKLIWVQPGKDDGRVALFETHPDHPDGEAFVAGPPVQVALTVTVERKIVSGDLVVVDEPKAKPEEKVHKTKAEVDEMLREAGNFVESTKVEEPFIPIRRGRPPKGK